MEAFINLFVIVFTGMMILFVEKFLYTLPPSSQRLMDYQKELDKMDANLLKEYGIEDKHYAADEIMKERHLIKCFTLIFSGAFLAFVLIGLIFLMPSFREISIICISAIVLICYGLIKVAESKKLAVAILLFVVVTTIVIEMLMALLPVYAFFGMCVLVAFLSILTMIPGSKKFALKHGI
jgi:hypothetical protein